MSKQSQQKLCRFLSLGRDGDLESLFLATDEEVDRINGREEDFPLGEVLGKHSYVEVNFKEDPVKLVTDDPMVVELVQKYNLETRFNLREDYQEWMENEEYQKEMREQE